MSSRKNLHAALRRVAGCLAAVAALFLCQCMYGDDGQGGTAFRQINLVADGTHVPSRKIDPNLVNPWGMAVSSGGDLWLAANGNGRAFAYDGTGEVKQPPISISGAGNATGSPTGVVANNTTGFLMPGGNTKALFLFCGEDGTVSAWSSGPAAQIVIDRSAAGAVYKGMTMAASNGGNFLYVANFRGRTVEVFNTSFQRDSSKAFRDSTLPAGFAPFNVVAVKNEIFVTYAKQSNQDSASDEPGVGNGYVNVFSPDGTFLRRFASQGQLNSPWGVAVTSGYFGPFFAAVFIGNFGDGLLNAFESGGRPLGRMLDINGRIVAVPGLWALYWAPGGGTYGEDRLYFTAGPDDESHGIFGYMLAF